MGGDKSVKSLKKTGRRRKLDESSKQQLIQFCNQHHTTTNEQGSTHLNQIIKPRTISTYLQRANFTRKKVSNEPENYPNERILQETREYMEAICDVPWENRVYMDESFLYNNEAPTMGRSLRGQPILRL